MPQNALTTYQAGAYPKVPRAKVALQFLPDPDQLDCQPAAGAITLLVSDGSTLTAAVAAVLQQRGQAVVLLCFDETLVRKSAQALPEGMTVITLPDTRDETIGKVISGLPGVVAQCIFLYPHLRFPLGQLGLQFDREKSLLKAAFLLAKHLKTPLHAGAGQHRPAFLTITRLDGALGTQNPGNVAPLGGSLPGLVKSLNLEWPEVFCRAVDLAPELPAETAAAKIVAELYDADQCLTETAIRADGKRFTLVAEPEPMLQSPALQAKITTESVFLVTGGARGVTADCVRKLAETFRCRFILVGRSALETAEPDWANGVSEPGELKRKAMEALQAKGEKPLPKTVQQMTNSVLAQREIQANLAFIRAQGAVVHYAPADTTDVGALREVLEQLEPQTGKVTGIIHGAGVLADKRIEDKKETDFDAVFDVKIRGLLALTQAVNLEAIRHVVLFSSVAGFYGNVGQSDYAMANEGLNRIAHLFHKNHPDVHVVSINWGAWDAGMVGPELKKIFEAHGVALVPAAEGPQALADQLSVGLEHQTQVILGGTLPMAMASTAGPLRSWTVRRRLLESDNPFLRHHLIQGNAVLPIIHASTWMVQSAAALYPGFQVQKAEKIQLYKGIVFDGQQPEAFILTLKELEKTENHIRVQVNISSDAGRKLPVQHYQAILALDNRKPEISRVPVPDLRSIKPLVPNASVFYSDGTLFHGPDFQGVRQVLEMTESSVLLACEHPGIPRERQGQFPVKSVNAFLTDVMYQGLLIWVRRYKGAACLPLRTASVHIWKAIPFGRPFGVALQVVESDDFAMEADITAFDLETGAVYLSSQRAGVTISRDLKWE